MNARKTAFIAALLLALICTGCGLAGGAGDSATAEAGRTWEDLPLVSWQEQPVIFQLTVNGGCGWSDNEWQAKEGGLYREVYDHGAIRRIVGATRNEPVHTGHRFAEGQYGIDSAHFCWLEWPAPPGATDDQWYLYIKANEDDATPTLLDQGTYDYGWLEEGGGVTMDYERGNVIWFQPEAEGEARVRCYESASGETTDLDTLSPGAEVEVAIGADDAAWCRRADDGSVTLLHHRLADGTTTVLAEDTALTDPLICGHFLVLRDEAANLLLVYDLAQGAWAFRISAELPVFDTAMTLERPLMLDDTHIAIVAHGSGAFYQLPAVDLASATACALETAPHTPMWFYPTDADSAQLKDVDAAYSYIQPRSDENTNYARQHYYNNYTDRKNVTAWVGNFLW